MIIAPNESNILQQLRTFLLAVLPDGYDVVAGGDELACDVRTQVAVGADDQLRCAHLAPPSWRIQSAASSGSVPSCSAFWHHFIAAETKRNGL